MKRFFHTKHETTETQEKTSPKVINEHEILDTFTTASDSKKMQDISCVENWTLIYNRSFDQNSYKLKLIIDTFTTVDMDVDVGIANRINWCIDNEMNIKFKFEDDNQRINGYLLQMQANEENSLLYKLRWA